MSRKKILICLLSGWVIYGVYGSVYAYEMSKEAIQERIKPVGEVQMNTDKQSEKELEPVVQEHVVEPVSEQHVQVNEEGKSIYEQYCTLCHATGMAGAPKFQDKADWQERNEKGMDVLLEHASQGYNVMPPMGTCNTCTQLQLQAAIEYMLPE